MTTIYIPVTWHVWRTNPIDYVGKKLITRDGRRVELRRGVSEFQVIIDGVHIETSSDVPHVAALLEREEVGLEYIP